ncbi:hypothetical protein [Nocardia aurea]|uniref:hypothetical protein n=1 Tax=Nocardia aurea TaxID=2144174 RepID=UPI0033A39EBA
MGRGHRPAATEADPRPHARAGVPHSLPARARQIPRRARHLPDTGRARLSYDQARDLLDAATTLDGPETGWDLHELRQSGLTHLGESGAGLLELLAKSRHRKAENLRRYFKPSPQAMRDLTALLGPGAERRR